MNVLILDDEKEIADLVEVYLKNENYNIYKFYDSDDAIKCIDTVKLDCAILDVMIKGKNGFEICQYIRNKKLNFPIIMLTAKIENQDKITGLTLGADDYITKPFNSLELVARVKSAIRRYKQYNNYKTDEEKIYIDGLEICKEQHKCLLYDKEIDLTPIEFDILLYLASKKGEVVSSEELFEKVWKEKYLDNNNTVMVHIRRIREKLKEDTKNPKYIKTVWGVGYKICKMIRDKGLNFPVIMLTAKIEDKDKIQGLTLGADDYITKPFNPLELIARVKSAYRRYTKYNEKSEENIIYINGLEIDQDKHICRLYETQIELTPMEFDILLYLAQKRGNVVSSEELFEKVWKEKYLENNNTVMVHIRRIREKLKENTKNPKFIKTVWGVGYKIEK